MTNSIPLAQLEPSNAASFAQRGDAHQGRIVAMVERQQSDTMGRLLEWADGTPRMQWLITLEQANGDNVTLYAKGGNFTPAPGTGGTGNSMLAAIGSAVRAAGAGAVELGAELAVVYTGDAAPQPGKTAAKLYTAQYRPAAPTSAVPVDLFTQSAPTQPTS